MTTFHPSSTPHDVIPGEATSSTPRDGSSRYVRSEPLGTSRTENVRSPFGFSTGLPLQLPRKSLPVAGLAALLLGPVGMVYATLFGAFVMAGVAFWAVVLGGVHALAYAWVLGVVWAVWAAHRRNRVIDQLEQRVDSGLGRAFADRWAA